MTTRPAPGYMERRGLLAGLSTIMVLSVASGVNAQTPEPNATLEAEKEKIVNNFCATWSSKDASQLTAYLDDEIEYHMFEGAPPINGKDSFSAKLQPFMSSMRKIQWDILRSTVMGDIILNERIDHFYRKEGSEQPENHFHIVGVFLVRDGKIKYWKDYNLSGQI